jgi:hypothetical protein
MVKKEKSNTKLKVLVLGMTLKLVRLVGAVAKTT